MGGPASWSHGVPTTNLVHTSSARRTASGLRYRPAWHTGAERGVVIEQTGSWPRGPTDSPRSAPVLVGRQGIRWCCRLCI